MSVQEVKVQEFPPKTGDIFVEYELEECLKSSKDCVVFSCHSVNNSLKYVTKIGINREALKLRNEINCYRDLTGGEGIPQLIYDNSWKVETEEWVEVDWAMIVIEKLCPRFAKTTGRSSSKILSLEELVPMAIQQISSFEFIHSRGLIHKGVKPDNFVKSEDGSKVYIIDFNKSKRYRKSDGHHIDYQRDDRLPKGLPLFHSLNYHKGIRCTRRDDLESLGFCWIYWLKGRLPWSSIKKHYWPTYVREIGECVANTTPEQLCNGLPENSSKYFAKYFENIRKLEFSEEPNYEELRQLIANSLSDSNNNQ